MAAAMLAFPAWAGGAETGYYSQPAIHDSTLIFESEGDLWITTLPEPDAVATIAHRITSSDGAETHPVFSPDGTQVLF